MINIPENIKMFRELRSDIFARLSYGGHDEVIWNTDRQKGEILKFKIKIVLKFKEFLEF